MQTIYLDISNKGVIPCIQAKQSEVGRKFLAIITDNGVPYNIPENSLLSVWYEGDTDAGNYSSVNSVSAFSIDGNKVTVELVAQMLLKPGNGELCLSITHGDGGETNTWNIPYCVEYKPGAGSSVPTEYYTALTEAGANAAKYAAEAKEAAETVSDALVESTAYPGCYYRTVDGDVEWINAPMLDGVEYKTTERSQGDPVYAKHIVFSLQTTTGTSGGLADVNVKHNISGIGKIVRCNATKGNYVLPMVNVAGGTVTVSRVSETDIVLRTYNYVLDPGEIQFDLYYTK